MNNHFENFNNSLSSQTALDKLSILDKTYLPNNDVGIRPMLAMYNKPRPELVVKRRKDGKVIIFTKDEILQMQI